MNVGKITRIALAVGLACIAIYIMPRMFEDVSDNCIAVQLKANRYLSASYPGQSYPSLIDPDHAGIGAQMKFPGLPPRAACAAMYWYLVADNVLGGALTTSAFEKR